MSTYAGSMHSEPCTFGLRVRFSKHICILSHMHVTITSCYRHPHTQPHTGTQVSAALEKALFFNSKSFNSKGTQWRKCARLCSLPVGARPRCEGIRFRSGTPCRPWHARMLSGARSSAARATRIRLCVLKAMDGPLRTKLYSLCWLSLEVSTVGICSGTHANNRNRMLPAQ